MLHAIKSQRRQTAQKDRGGISLSFSPSFSLTLVSDVEDAFATFSTWNRVPRTRARAASTWFQVACRGYRARTSPSAGGTRTFRVHPPLLPSTFFPAPHTPSPVPFRHNNRAVSQRVFNGRRLHATRPRAGPPRPLPHRVASTLPFFLFLSPFFPSSRSSHLSLSLSLFLSRSRLFSIARAFLRLLPVSLLCLDRLSLLLLLSSAAVSVRPFSILAETRDDLVSSNTRKYYFLLGC